ADDRALLRAARDHVAQVSARLAAEEPLVAHPEVVEHLREVLVAAVADERDDALLLFLTLAVTEGGRDQRAGRRAREDPLLAEQGARRHEALLVRNGVCAPNPRQIADGRDEV